jgi:GGDEF domain-containing protein
MFYHLAARYGGEEFVLLLWDILCTVISYEGWTEFMALQRSPALQLRSWLS